MIDVIITCVQHRRRRSSGSSRHGDIAAALNVMRPKFSANGTIVASGDGDAHRTRG